MTISREVQMPHRLRVILAHLSKRPSVTPLEALGLYGEQRLSDCVHELKKRGYRIETEIRKDLNGRKYAHYTVPTAAVGTKVLEVA